MDHLQALKKFGEKVRDFRKAAGVSQEALAEHAGVSRESISNIERGRYFCTMETLCRISEKLGKNIDEFFASAPRARKPAQEAAVDAAIARLREVLAAGEKLTADDVAALLNVTGKTQRATRKSKTNRMPKAR